jgi:DNA polymerase-3 subunit gamma/tau
MVTAVADENPAAAFSLAGRAVEFGYDLRLVCRELARLARDLLLVCVDPSAAADADLAGESERERLGGLAARFSREDLLRGFDLLTGAEKEIRESAQPRYFLEMLLLRWIHLRKLLPIEDVIAGLDRGLGGGAGQARPGGGGSGGGLRPSLASTRPTFSRPDPLRKPGGPQAVAPRLQDMRAGGAAAARAAEPVTAAAEPEAAPAGAADPLAADVGDRFLAEVKRSKAAFFGMVIAQAQTVECDGRQLVVTFSPEREHLRAQVEARRAELEVIAAQVAGRRVPVATARGIMPSPGEPGPPIAAPAPVTDGDLRARALGDATVQALLEVIPSEISEVEEM